MTIAAQMEVIETAVAAWAGPLNGAVRTAGDLTDVQWLLKATGDGPQVVILWDGETTRGEAEELSMVDRSFLIFISRGRGLALDSGAARTRGTAEQPTPLYDLIEGLREVLRGIEFEAADSDATTEIRPRYESFKPSDLLRDNGLLDGHEARITIGTRIPIPS